MFEWSVKKVLARRVFKIFSGMRAFLVERFTAKRFLFRFLRSKNEKKEILRQVQNDKICC